MDFQGEEMSQVPSMIDQAGKTGIELAAKTSTEASQTLDPTDWSSFRAQAHRMLDDMLGYIETIRERPVWQPAPDEVRAHFHSPAPRQGEDIAQVHAEFLRDVLPFAQGNVHPGFMGWVNGGGTPVGMVAEMLAAGLNANLGGRNHIPVEVERQVTRWVAELFGFPEGASGLFVTGTSMANLIAVLIARDAALGVAVRGGGVAADSRRLTAYTSTAVHSCVPKAMDIAGLGSDALRRIPADSRCRIDLALLQNAIRADREAGFTPFLVVGTAGTVNTGAIDDLAALANLCRREKLWFHVDGAFGALARLAPDLAPKLDGIERADSVAFDFHKWGQAPYDAGFVLVRDSVAHKNAFALPAAYLERAERGLAASSPWPCDFGPDLSRGFRALKVWFTLKVHGTDALGASISRTCALARYLEGRINATPELELMAPVELNIVCFRYRAEKPDAEASNQVNHEIVVRLQESGIVAPSTTRIDGRTAIRAAIVNHRTSRTEIDALVDNVLVHGRALSAPAPQAEIAHSPRQAQPEDPMSLVHLASSLQKEGETAQALEHYERALRINPDIWQAHLGLSVILADLGDHARADRHRQVAFHGRSVVPLPYRGQQAPITILELVAIGAGNTRIRNFLSDTVFKRSLVATEFYEPSTPLPPHQLIVNAIGDADAAAAALAGAATLVKHSTAPVINAPAAVLATSRCAIAERLVGVPGVVTAKTLTLPRAWLAATEAALALGRQGFEFPLLVRTPGFHGGENFVRVQTPAGLPAALTELPGPDLTVINFLDARAADGKIRKYRAMMIDGALYPLHLAVSEQWKIHFFSAEMADNPEHRAEDAAFLADMPGALGPKAMAALERIQKTLGLDYGGIDFGLNADGDILLFEANAAMAVLPPGEDARWDYRRPAVERILRAIRKMLVDRAKSYAVPPAG
jgi:glutamate/tyrosine decarboxylase-like PLP-dependent enzyme